jgi:hypothetical protein
MAFEDHALLCADDDTFTGKFAGAENAIRLFSRTGRRLRLIWVDDPSAGLRTDTD